MFSLCLIFSFLLYLNVPSFTCVFLRWWYFPWNIVWVLIEFWSRGESVRGSSHKNSYSLCEIIYLGSVFWVDFVFAVDEKVIGCTPNADIVFAIQFQKLPSIVLAVKTHYHDAVPNLIIITLSLYHSFYSKTHTFSTNALAIKPHTIRSNSHTIYFPHTTQSYEVQTYNIKSK